MKQELTSGPAADLPTGYVLIEAPGCDARLIRTQRNATGPAITGDEALMLAMHAEIAALKKQVWMYEVCSNTHGCAELHRNAGRYQLLRRGQHWSVIDGVGDTLRAEALDAAVDTAIAQAVQPAKQNPVWCEDCGWSGADCAGPADGDSECPECGASPVFFREAIAQAVQPS
jgi:hypothetical protein